MSIVINKEIVDDIIYHIAGMIRDGKIQLGGLSPLGGAHKQVTLNEIKYHILKASTIPYLTFSSEEYGIERDLLAIVELATCELENEDGNYISREHFYMYYMGTPLTEICGEILSAVFGDSIGGMI